MTSITVQAGRRKDGQQETLSCLKVSAGETLAIVGPTGSGKSQLLSDIEQLAQADTISGRTVLINGSIPEDNGFDAGLVAQLTQKTSFILDCSVESFLQLHAQSRGKTEERTLVEKVMEKANFLSGEPISAKANLQVLSGGQSRALMIADMAYISNSPIILIDEIENAGIDKLSALQVLTDSNKPIFISTHDPVLMLMVSQRLVMKNGGMESLFHTSSAEKSLLESLKTMDDHLTTTRDQLRNGEPPHTGAILC
ncbi:MAG: hypothetical protein CSA21_01405 [Deltaproteobacteria bacterium]|nr:MAG: hypothetical protein CSA21_01405 [Deltaproteobacteria bacterium]